MNLKVTIAGAVKDCANYLPEVIKNIENISKLFSNAGYVFIENDSRDNSKSILKSWSRLSKEKVQKSEFQLISLDGLDVIKARTARLEVVRNTYIEAIKSHKTLSNSDYLIIIDMDEIGAYPIDTRDILKAIIFLQSSRERAAVFSNQTGFYYDMWALRHEKFCPGDIWEEVANYVLLNECSDDTAYTKIFKKRIFSIDKSLNPIKVDSAFGGFGIYKMQYILENPNPYLGSKIKAMPMSDGSIGFARWQVCEHVHFNQGIKHMGGDMYIFPSLVNYNNQTINFNPSFARSLLY
jgi:hypothetical protein